MPSPFGFLDMFAYLYCNYNTNTLGKAIGNTKFLKLFLKFN